ncbi:MAG: response regulator [Candidatus Omnitrophica bacterium]|nr:response regulator [Candidatus Omnitrophota bacterium]
MNQTKTIKNVLVVDDDPVQIKLLEKTLKDEGYHVHVCEEAADGLQTAMDQHPDLIVLDVMMPVINGFNFCKLLKNEESKKDILILLLTSRDEEDDIKIGMEMGADAYLTKPVNIQEFLKTLKFLETMDRYS